jgi:signal transduction histidine kinase
MKARRLFQDWPIQHQLRAVILTISGLAVLGSCAVFVTYQWFSTRDALAARLGVMAEIVADQSTAAVEFDQEAQATAILRALKAERQIVVAAVYNRDGRIFARYLREGADPAHLPPGPGSEGRAFEGGNLLVFQPLRSDKERIGTLFLKSDMADARKSLMVNLVTVGLVLLGATAAILFLSGRLGGVITEPVLHLAGTVQAVSSRKDYSIRAERRGADELGRLIDGFNDMLSQIQERDSALAQARDLLEQRVQERTRELKEEIAERKAAENRLQEKDLRLTEAQEVARLGSWEWTLVGNRIAWSDEVYRIYALMPARFGGGFDDFVASAHPDDRPALREGLEGALRKREPLDVDYRIMRPDGTVRHLHARGKVVLDDAGRPVRVVGTLQDVTERKQADQAIQDLNRELSVRMADIAAVNKELEGFSYSVSHDLRAPLRAIGGYSQMLIEDYTDRVDAEGQRYLRVIIDNVKKMGQLIDDLLAFSQAGRKPLQKEEVALERMTREVFSELRDLHPDRKIDLKLGDLPPGRGDPAMIRQALVNLISNAVKYTRGRDPALIEIGARPDGAQTVYHIRDNGVGFQMEFADKLFGVFQRLHTSKEFEGTGVGLALVQRIIQRHGGRVWGEGKVNGGATFYFTLPRAEGEGDGRE